jgi:dTDP-4-dehydrorhamnose reductase
MKVLIFGSKGYMGGYFRRLYPEAVCPSVDIADQQGVGECLDTEKPDVVINCAGKSGVPNVDWCEDHKLETVRSNVQGPLVLLEECAKRSIYWVHLSSGCIYEGDNEGRGFSEEDLPNYFGSFYSRTKGWTDQILKEFPVLQLRLRMPFDETHEVRNLIMKLKKYPKVLDAQNSITHVPDMLAATAKLIEKRATGIFNLVNPGTISPYHVMELYKEMVDPAHTFERLTLESLAGVVKAGRSNCLLNTHKLAKFGITLPSVEDAMRTALSGFAKGQ